ncbi:hypothetical protein LZ31DRAFT_553523 [Colletotrichum somersetense]|nr:hypothetical protein LZ31DRAFT_553523 [Colletotrichum somersetense]
MTRIPKWVREAGKFSDFTIVCKNTEIRVHRVVLYGQSGFFKALLDGNVKKAQEGVVTFDDVAVDVMNHLVEFCYSDDREFSLEPSDLKTNVSVWILADRLKAGQAMRELETSLMNHLRDYEYKKSAVQESLVDMVFSHQACAESAVGCIFAEAMWVVFARSEFLDADLALLTKYTELMEKLLFWSHRYTQGGIIFNATSWRAMSFVSGETERVRESAIEEYFTNVLSCPLNEVQVVSSVDGPMWS